MSTSANNNVTNYKDTALTPGKIINDYMEKNKVSNAIAEKHLNRVGKNKNL